MLITCPSGLIDTTLAHLREAGQRHCECVVLWLGRRHGDMIWVEDAYLPPQTAQADMFHIPPAGMTALQAELRRRRLMVAAQVHSHPYEAFHSKADDRWAIIRHEHALSLVVPNFASTTTVSNFLDDSKVYRLSASAQWIEVPGLEVGRSCLRIS
ncbi:MAG: Mov34/MPN/PAD-1 family protein [Acidobacteriaceae bacterium]